MDHSTSPASGGHSPARPDAASGPLAPRGFLGSLATGTFPIPLASVPTMTGAQYVALLGGAVRPRHQPPTTNSYQDASSRWVEIASGPLVEIIDGGALIVCPECRFVHYASLPCQICLEMQTLTEEDVSRYFEDFNEDGETPREELERDVDELRMAWSVDLFDGPEDARIFARAVHALRQSEAVQ